MSQVAGRILAGGAVAAGAVLGYRAGFGSRSQWFGTFPYRADPAADGSGPVIALTFDDGPNEPHTSRLLDTLGEHQVPATFFQVGVCVERYPDVVRRTLAEGHVLANHSYRHAFHRYLSRPRQQAEIAGGADALERVAGVRPALYRPPWLCHWPWVLRSIAAAGARPVSGTFGHPLEIFQPPARELARGAAARARSGAIMIMHDGLEGRGGFRGRSVAAVEPLIQTLKVRGFRFVTVDRLLEVPAYR
jgi:peptidoglycan/xylan/chitin deacetylase (PgdA/CDA1 family)